MIRTLKTQLSALLINVIALAAMSPASFAQTRRTTVKPAAATTSKPASPGCAGGWSGVVTFKKTLKDSLDSDEPGIRKNTDRIIHKNSRDYSYDARAIVDGSDPKNAVVNTKVSFTDNDLQWGQEKVFDTCNSRENGHWFIIEGNDDRQTQAQVSGSAKSFGLYVDALNGTYSFNLAFPDAQGQFKHEQHTKRTGHCQPQNNLPYDKSDNEQVRIDGERFSIDSQKVDPNNPDTLSGTKIWGDDGKGQVRTFIFEVTWRFTRCPQKLMIADLKFEHPKFPNPDDWKEIEPTRGTIDGNRVKVKATVVNLSSETRFADLKVSETYHGDKWNGARADEPLPQGESSLRLEGGEEREVEFVWDTEGQSWFDDGRPHLLHRIKAELSENGQKKDEKTEPLNIAPKPLVLVHGLWSDYKVWEPLYQNLMTESHSYQWKAYLVGEKLEHGVMNMGGGFMSKQPAASIFDNADQLAKYVLFAQDDANAWHVDMVAHSTGGLVARLYLHKLMPVSADARPVVKHLVMLGTPNGGVPCVDIFVGKLGLLKDQLVAAKELTNEDMLNFNRFVVNTGGTKLSALAGNPVPVICGGMEWNDGFVTVKSATFGVADTGQSNDLNYQLVDGKNFGNFVKPHLVTGPEGTYPIAVKNDPTDWRRWQMQNATGMKAPEQGMFESYAVAAEPPTYRGGPSDSGLPDSAAFDASPNSTFAEQIKLTAGQTLDIDLAVETAPNFGITFMADPSVSASLVNDNGVVMARSAAGSPFAGSLFRSLLVAKPVELGHWKLKLVNTSKTEQIFVGYSWSLPAGSLAAPPSH